MSEPVPLWLSELHHHLLESTFTDLRVVSYQKAYLYNAHNFEPVPATLMKKLFTHQEDWENKLTELAWQLELRLDPYHPYLASDVQGIGRVTMVKGNLLGSGSQLFLRFLNRKPIKLAYDDPQNLFTTFKQNFTRYPWLICGASGSGKTSLLFSELHNHFSDHTVVFMDRFQEKPFAHPMWIFLREQSLQANHRGRVSSHHLLDLAFKFGASVLCFGEIRKNELVPFFHGLLSGHNHIYGTFHARSIEALWLRMDMIQPQASSWAKKSLASLFLHKDARGTFVIQDLYLPPQPQKSFP